MATANLAVSTGTDDGYWNYGGGADYSNSSAGAYLGSSFSQSIGAWLRFPSATIPNASTINSAVLTITSHDTRSDSVSLIIRGVAEDNPTYPTSRTDAAGRSVTSAGVTWSPSAFTAGSTYSPGDLSTVVQEIVNRAGFTSGNAIMLYILNNGTTSTNLRQLRSYNNSPAAAATLDIDYTAAGGASGVKLTSSKLFMPSIIGGSLIR